MIGKRNNDIKKMKDLSIIIVCYKGWGKLLKCLESLSLFKLINFSMEVIIVDNNSPDGEIHEIEKKFPGFRFIINKVNGGFANGNNLGSRIASGEFLLFLNPDTIVLESELLKMVDVARNNPDYHVVSCKQVNNKGKLSRDNNHFPSLRRLTGIQRTFADIGKSEKSETNNNGISFPDWVSGAVMILGKEIFQNLDGFDEDYWMYYEDVDLCQRVIKTGGRVALCNGITIEHNHGGSSRVNIKTSSITKSEVLISEHVYVSKNFPSGEKIIAHVLLILINLISGLFLAVAGLILFFIPGIYVKTLVFQRMLKYYLGSLRSLTWISPQSVNYRRSKSGRTPLNTQQITH